MPAPKGNQYAKGNSGGRPSKYKPEYAETASKLCARLGFTDEQLADWFEVDLATIHRWKLKHQEFCDALRAGKAETDDLVERGTLQHIMGYYVIVDEMDRFGNVKQMKKWIPGNAHAGMKWLSCRRPEQYREQKDVKHSLNMDDAFLRFLDQMDEQQKLERSNQAKLIEHVPDEGMTEPSVGMDRQLNVGVGVELSGDVEGCTGRAEDALQGRNAGN
jgi:hypothetical protein